MTKNDKKDFFAKSLTRTKKVEEAPAPMPQALINEKIREIHEAEVMRLTLDIPAEMHRRLKIRAAELGVSMKEYAASLFERDLKE